MAKGMSRLKKTVVVASVAALSLAGAGVAVAYWTSTGTGTGEAQTCTQAAVFSFNVGDPQGDPLVPGGTGQTVDFEVYNPGPETLRLADVTVTMATVVNNVVVPWAPAGCVGVDNYTVEITTPVVPGNIPGDEYSALGVVTVTMIDAAFDQDACQGLTVPLHFVANPIVN